MNYKSLVLILLSIFTFNAVYAETTWTLLHDGTGTVIVSGTGRLGFDRHEARFDQSDIRILIIEEGFTEIAVDAFRFSDNLTSVTIPNSVTSIETDAFDHCSKLSSISFGNSLISIGEYAFRGCAVKSLRFPNSLKEIKEYAFCGCDDLSSITFGNSLTTIGDGAFSGCYLLPSVVLPNSLTTIGNHAFDGCDELTSVVIGNSVTSIGERAFMFCSKLVSVTFGNSVTSIGKEAFRYCSSLRSADLPGTVTSIGREAFADCQALTSFYIPYGLTTIDIATFSNCTSLTSVSVPKSVTNIEWLAFKDCSSLTSVTIPNSVTKIANDVFNGCDNLREVNIHVNSNLVIGDGSSSFGGCNNLNAIRMYGETVPVVEYGLGVDYDKVKLYVPSELYDEYRSISPWNNFVNVLVNENSNPVTPNLTDGEEYTGNTEVEGQNITYTRTFNNTAWQALYIPFSMSYNDWKNDFEVAYISGISYYYLDDYDPTVLGTIINVYKKVGGTLIPNTPYLIRAKTTGKKTINVRNTTLYRAEEKSCIYSTHRSKFTFTGTYSTIPAATLIANEYYAMGGGSIIMTDGKSDLKPYRWYLKVDDLNSSNNAAKNITVNVLGEESETTGIVDLEVADHDLQQFGEYSEQSSVYDLNGRRVKEKVLKPGMYIKNGNKFIIK